MKLDNGELVAALWGFFIYIIGKTEDGDWVGVWTKAVWT